MGTPPQARRRDARARRGKPPAAKPRLPAGAANTGRPAPWTGGTGALKGRRTASKPPTGRPETPPSELRPPCRTGPSKIPNTPLDDRSEIWYIYRAESQTPPRGSGEGGGHHGISPGPGNTGPGAGAPRPGGDPMLVEEAGAGSRRSRRAGGDFRALDFSLWVRVLEGTQQHPPGQARVGRPVRDLVLEEEGDNGNGGEQHGGAPGPALISHGGRDGQGAPAGSGLTWGPLRKDALPAPG